MSHKETTYTEQFEAEITALQIELAEAKRLLQAAVEDIYKARQGCNCNICDMPTESIERCQYEKGKDCKFKWQYADEALKLLGEDGESND